MHTWPILGCQPCYCPSASYVPRWVCIVVFLLHRFPQRFSNAHLSWCDIFASRSMWNVFIYSFAFHHVVRVLLQVIIYSRTYWIQFHPTEASTADVPIFLVTFSVMAALTKRPPRLADLSWRYLILVRCNSRTHLAILAEGLSMLSSQFRAILSVTILKWKPSRYGVRWGFRANYLVQNRPKGCRRQVEPTSYYPPLEWTFALHCKSRVLPDAFFQWDLPDLSCWCTAFSLVASGYSLSLTEFALIFLKSKHSLHFPVFLFTITILMMGSMKPIWWSFSIFALISLPLDFSLACLHLFWSVMVLKCFSSVSRNFVVSFSSLVRWTTATNSFSSSYPSVRWLVLKSHVQHTLFRLRLV